MNVCTINNYQFLIRKDGVGALKEKIIGVKTAKGIIFHTHDYSVVLSNTRCTRY